MGIDEQKPVGRRGLFRQLLAEGLGSVEKAGREVGQKVTQGLDLAKKLTGRAEPEPPPPAPTIDLTRYLRPPGAVDQFTFSQVCSRCGLCEKACPADAIGLEINRAGGLPFIVAREQPCVICSDLSCMKVCPTGALKLVEHPSQIRMGVAAVDHFACLRCTWREDQPPQDCRLCIEVCPLGEAAIGLDVHDMVTVRDGCTGCGLCEHRCPTEPPAIWVESYYDPAHDMLQD